MLRRVLPRRAFSTSAATSATSTTSLQARCTALFDKLMDVEWVDSDTPTAPMIEDATALIDEYRPLYISDKPHDDLYRNMEALYVAKESAAMVESYGEYSEKFVRAAEHNNGVLGSNTTVKEGDADEPLQMIREFVDFVNVVEDKRIREKVEEELGNKIVQLKMIYSIENFSAEVAPLTGNNVLTTPRPHAPLPPGKSQ